MFNVLVINCGINCDEHMAVVIAINDGCDTCCRELLDVKLAESRLGLEVCGLVSNANYNVKRAVFLLFINSESFSCLKDKRKKRIFI